jgi:peroxiredoxin
MAVVSVDPPEVQSAFRAGLGARYTFLSDSERRWLTSLDLLEESDTTHRPYRPTAFTLHPDLTVHRRYDGNWYWGRPSAEDLRRDLREISAVIREDFQR